MHIQPNVFSPRTHRYSIAIHEIDSRCPKILDVGGYKSRAAIFSNSFNTYEYTSLNVGSAWYGGEESSYTYDGINIPFSNESYEYVISVDSFEHIDRSIREHVLSEMIRVASRRVIIVVPFCSKLEQTDESYLLSVCQKYGVEPVPSLVEHELFGLPCIEDINFLASKFNGKIKYATDRREYWSIQMAMLWNSIALDGESEQINEKLQLFQERSLKKSKMFVDARNAYRCVLIIDK